MAEDTKSTDHRVLIKITHRGAAGATPDRKAERVGDVLLVRVTEPSGAIDGARHEESVTAHTMRPGTVVQVVTHNPALNPSLKERQIKETRIANVVLELIEVGIAVPA